MPLRDLTGQKFGRLTVIEYFGSRKGGGAIWRCQCDCGVTTNCQSANLVNGRTRSCGGHPIGNPATLRNGPFTNFRHGKSGTKIHNIWCGMRQRCENPESGAFEFYGGRGIAVCERWQTFENFLADMGEPPPGGSLERIDNNGPYSPDNCRWASRTEQVRNRRTTVFITHNGETKSLGEWAEQYGLPTQTLWFRYKKTGLHGDELFRPLRVVAKGAARGKAPARVRA